MKYVSTDKAPQAIGPYSQAVISGGMVYTSGQIAIDPATGNIAGATIEEQTELVCTNIENLLNAAGTDISKVVKTVCFLADMNDFEAFNRVYAKYFPENPPARSCVEVSTLPMGIKLEIEAIAVQG